MENQNHHKKPKSAKNLRREKIQILYTDEHLCVINKPSGLLSVPYPGSRAPTAQSFLEEIMHKKGTYSSSHKPLPVHRLDKDTSGVMVFALTESAQKKIMDNWHQLVTERLYRAIAENPKNKKLTLPTEGLIDDGLAFNSRNQGYVPADTAQDHPATVPARTNYKILYAGPTHTLFELSLDTGKKNQIRAHLASKGYPLAGDENYRAKTDNFNRLCLHARTLEFYHPFTGEKLKFEVPEPQNWLEYVQKGDLNPKTPVWIEAFYSSFDKKGEHFHTKHENSLNLGQKRLTKKDRAHMNFIEAGKKSHF